MGADFVGCVVPLQHTGKGGYKKFGKKSIAIIINSFTPDEEEQSDFMQGFDLELSDEEHDDKFDIKLFNKMAKEIVHDFFYCIGNKDVGVIIFRTVTLVVSGGTTWGDPPTDSFDKLDRFVRLPWRLRQKFGEAEI